MRHAQAPLMKVGKLGVSLVAKYYYGDQNGRIPSPCEAIVYVVCSGKLVIDGLIFSLF
jgi:hypothetical protein